MNALRVFRHGLLVGTRDFAVFWTSWWMWLLTWALRVVTSAAMWVLLGRLLDSEELLMFLLVGQVVIVGPQAAGWAAAASTWERFSGTYPLLVISPSSLVPAVMGRTFIWFLNGVATSGTTFVILVPLFGLRVPLAGLLLAPVLIAVVCASFYALSLFLGALVMRAPRLRNVVHNTASMTIVAIGGVVVPTSFWPAPVALAAGCLPVTHGLQAIRVLLAGGPGIEVMTGVLLEIAVGLCWFAIAVFAMDRMAEAGRRDGSIEFSG